MPRSYKNETRNLLTLRPLATRESQAREDGKEDILIPRFGDHALGRWLGSKARKPYHRIKLDDVGTHIWRRLDGQTTVKAIAESLRSEFGERVEPVFDRLNLFVGQLARAKVIKIED